MVGKIPVRGKFSSNKAPWRAVTNCVIWFNNNISWKVNDGAAISFWLDNWNSKSPISLSTPRLYALSTNKNGSVNDFWNPILNDWDIHINRPLREHETQLWHDIKSSLIVPLSNRGPSKPI
ncbi:LINE-1 retrotransposable element ORF2 protein [Cucumis melo var. makuwa]|uniref:LINE-1 retrotransposable element ORF2 protein n=1 Tax=Cucumis melo var. makuwa TaxID=1194695 RepID=A0A5A7UPD1_CUCMM|nr:LINE-1 retrotransposable element ORF2 protein [Cucumis melo var. makuwa]TYK22316.1 LINE-1 retrotransposable element ORF2 protein [Cucumis melo var. makuwa]